MSLVSIFDLFLFPTFFSYKGYFTHIKSTKKVFLSSMYIALFSSTQNIINVFYTKNAFLRIKGKVGIKHPSDICAKGIGSR